jgi:hypothetical protein
MNLPLPMPPRLVIILYGIDLLFALAFAIHLMIGMSETGLIARHFHPGREANLPTWYSSTQWVLAGTALAAYAAYPKPGLRRGLRLYLPAAGALLLSLDETAGFHEWIGGRSDALLPDGTREGTVVAGTGIWMLILIPLAVVAALVVARSLAEHLRASPSAMWLFLIGGLVFLSGAGVVELITNVGVGNRPFQLGIQIVEESVEMLGATTVLWGAIDLLHVSDIGVGRRLTRRPRAS